MSDRQGAGWDGGCHISGRIRIFIDGLAGSPHSNCARSNISWVKRKENQMSHKWVTAVVVCVCIAGVCRCAAAGQLVYEPFDYPPGELLDGKVAPNGQSWAAAGDL